MMVLWEITQLVSPANVSVCWRSRWWSWWLLVQQVSKGNAGTGGVGKSTANLGSIPTVGCYGTPGPAPGRYFGGGGGGSIQQPGPTAAGGAGAGGGAGQPGPKRWI